MKSWTLNMQKRANRYLLRISSLLAILFVWWVISNFQLVNPLFIPNVGQTFAAIWKIIINHGALIEILTTFYRAIAGLAIATLIGIPMGMLLGKVRWFFEIADLPIEFLRSIPSSALFPLFILFLGIGDASKIGIVVYACSLIIAINAYYGVLPSKEKKDRINMLRSFGASKYQVFWRVIFMDALPHILAGIRVSLSLSFVLVVVTEMFLTANSGLGKMIYDFYLQYRIPEMYAVIILLGLTGFSVNKLFSILERRLIFWSNIN